MAAKSLPVHVIVPEAVYTLASASAALGLRPNCLPREIRLRRLRVSKRAGRYYILGQWLRQWLEAGELARRKATSNGAVNGSANN